MAVSQRIPNGYIVLMLTAREAVMLSDEILDPGDFPFQSSESQVTAYDVKRQLQGLVQEDTMDRLGEASKSLIAMMRARDEEQEHHA